MKKVSLLTFCFFSLSLFFIINSFSFAQNIDTKTEAQKLGFPYSVNFTEKEIKYLKSLPKATLQKLINAAKLTQSQTQSGKNFQEKLGGLLGGQTAGKGSTSPATIPQPLTPQQPQNPYLPTPPSTPQQDSQVLGTPSPSSPTPSSSQQDNQQPAQEKPLTAEQIAKCPNFGVDGGGNTNCLSPKLKLDLTRLCALGGKKIKVISGYRPAATNPKGSGSQHILGKAIDTKLDGMSDQDKTTALLFMFARCYTGFGVYGAGSNIHIDHRSKSPSTTYEGGTMRWGSDKSLKSCKSTSAPPWAVKAFDAMGLDRCATPDRGEVVDKAIAALKSMGKADMVPPGKGEQLCAGIDTPNSCGGK